jgi:hypothetical protein
MHVAEVPQQVAHPPCGAAGDGGAEAAALGRGGEQGAGPLQRRDMFLWFHRAIVPTRAGQPLEEAPGSSSAPRRTATAVSGWRSWPPVCDGPRTPWERSACVQRGPQVLVVDADLIDDLLDVGAADDAPILRDRCGRSELLKEIPGPCRCRRQLMCRG